MLRERRPGPPGPVAQAHPPSAIPLELLLHPIGHLRKRPAHNQPPLIEDDPCGQRGLLVRVPAA